MVMHEQPIPFITLPNWVKAASKCGFNVEPVFRELGIETDLIHLETATVSQPLLEKAMEACIARAQHHHFPFALGETFSFDYLPDIETFVTTSSTMREAMRVFDWVRELINPLINVHLEEENNVARLVLDQVADVNPARAAVPYFTETTFAAIYKFARKLLGERVQFSQLHFRHSAPRYVQAYEEFFHLPVAFNQPRYEILFDRTLLDMPLEGAFPALHKQAEYRVELLLGQIPRRQTTGAQIEDFFTRNPAWVGRGIQSVAKALDMHPRTLQRRLRDENVSFAELQDRARYQAATEYLQQGNGDLEKLSEHLGFSDRRSFTRAFKRWSGLSPSVFRQHRKQPNTKPE